MHSGTSLLRTRRLLVWAAIFCAATTFASPAHARPFHLWNISEVYTNSSGTLQFIELTEITSFQNNLSGQQISVSNVGGTQTNPFPITTNQPSDGLTHMLLFGTAGIHAAGAPTPDYIIPNGFLFSAGGSISFFGQNGGTYTALPTDGTLARIWDAGNVANSETNYSGQTGSISPVPETFDVGVDAARIRVRGTLETTTSREIAIGPDVRHREN